jgi:hypothetical protein
MAYESLYEFTEWCYNSYVDAVRAHEYTKAYLLRQVLQQHYTLNLKPGRFVSQRQQARNLLRAIDKAEKAGITDTIHYTGAKFLQELNAALADYEALLRRMDFPEDYIQELLIQKKLDYGN